VNEEYVTGPGETLETIGQKLNVAWDELFKANQDTIFSHIAKSFTLPHNTTLVVPAASDAPTTPPTEPGAAPAA
jgi:hypothetical protein